VHVYYETEIALSLVLTTSGGRHVYHECRSDYRYSASINIGANGPGGLAASGLHSEVKVEATGTMGRVLQIGLLQHLHSVVHLLTKSRRQILRFAQDSLATSLSFQSVGMMIASM
jgi:hypothetical protein